MLFNNSTVLLFLTNLLPMSVIVFLLLPFVDIVTLSKNIQEYQAHMTKNDLTITLGVLYLLIILGFGIIGPMSTLNGLRLSPEARANETPTEKLIRIIETTYAVRDYLLAGFSLFFILVIWRLFDFIIFSAKLHEFSELMSNYDLVDINYTDEKAEIQSKSSTIIDENLELEDEEVEVDYVHWPSVIQLGKSDTRLIKSFFKENPRKTIEAPREDTSVAAFPEKQGEDLKIVKAAPSEEKTKTPDQIIDKLDEITVVSEFLSSEDQAPVTLKSDKTVNTNLTTEVKQEKKEPENNKKELLNNKQSLETNDIKETNTVIQQTTDDQKPSNPVVSEPVILQPQQSKDNHKNNESPNQTIKTDDNSKSSADKERKSSNSEQIKEKKTKEGTGIVIKDSNTSGDNRENTKIDAENNKDPKPKND